MELKAALIIPDMHVPYHHVRATNLMLEAAKYIGIHEIVVLGDLADFYFANSHGKSPQLLNTTAEEIKAVNLFLDVLDQEFPDAKKKYIEGNHEHRLTRFIQTKAPEIFGFVDCRTLFNIDSRPGWSWHSYTPSQRTSVLGSKLFARHEPFGTSAKQCANRALCSLVYGHIHRIEESHIVGLDGTNHVAFSVGWLGDKRKDLIFGYTRGHAQWQMGFGIVYVDSAGCFYHHKIHILDRNNRLSCVVNGKRFKA